MAEGSIQRLRVGDEAPAFELPGTDGETHALSGFDGAATVVVFTCNHCPYAQAKVDPLNDVAADYEEVAVVGVNSNDDEQYPEDSFEEMVEAVESGRVRYDAYLRDESQEVAKAYGAVCTPDPFLLRDDGGRYVLAYHGRVDDATNPDDEPTRNDLREAIDAVLAGEDVDAEFRPSRGCSIKWRPGNEPDDWDEL